MNRTVDSTVAKCSTPVFGQENTQPVFPFSEIRRKQILLTVDSAAARKKSKQRRRRNVTRNSSPLTRPTDPNSDSDYETVAEYETYSQEAETGSRSPGNCRDSRQLLDDQLRPSDVIVQSSDSTAKLFSSLTGNEYTSGHCQDSYFHEEAPSSSFLPSNQIVGSPVFQKCFKDPAGYKTYSGPGRKDKASLSEISFSTKRVNDVSMENGSSSRILSRESDILAGTSPANEAWSSKSLSYRADRLWKDFTRDTTHPPEQLSRSKYARISDRSGRCERFASLHRKCETVKEVRLERFASGKRKEGVPSSIEPPREPCRRDDKFSITGERIWEKNHKSTVVNQLCVNDHSPDDFSLTSLPEDKSKMSGQRREERSIGFSLAKAGLPVSRKSKPRIISKVTVKINITEIRGLAPKK